MEKKINKKNKRKKCQKMTTKLENASQNFRYRGGGAVFITDSESPYKDLSNGI